MDTLKKSTGHPIPWLPACHPSLTTRTSLFLFSHSEAVPSNAFWLSQIYILPNFSASYIQSHHPETMWWSHSFSKSVTKPLGNIYSPSVLVSSGMQSLDSVITSTHLIYSGRTKIVNCNENYWSKEKRGRNFQASTINWLPVQNIDHTLLEGDCKWKYRVSESHSISFTHFFSGGTCSLAILSDYPRFFPLGGLPLSGEL